MAVPVANLTAEWVDGALYLYDSGKTAVLIISSTGFDVRGGGVTISTANLSTSTLSVVTISTETVSVANISTATLTGGITVSGGAVITGGATVSSGLALYGEKVINKTGNATLTKGEAGAIITCSTDSVFITLLSAASSALAGATYTIRNIATTGQNVIVITASGDSMIGCGISTSNVLKNVSTTHVANDQITLTSGASTTWWIAGLVGTWSSTS